MCGLVIHTNLQLSKKSMVVICSNNCYSLSFHCWFLTKANTHTLTRHNVTLNRYRSRSYLNLCVCVCAHDHQADVHARDCHGEMPLHFAALNEEATIVKQLILAGAGPPAPDARHDAPLMGKGGRHPRCPHGWLLARNDLPGHF